VFGQNSKCFGLQFGLRIFLTKSKEAIGVSQKQMKNAEAMRGRRVAIN